MNLLTIFFSTFLLVFIGELGDKTQIASGTGALANRRNMRLIFFSSSLALATVAGLTVFGAGLIPSEFIPLIKKLGGVLLVLYGIYLFYDAHTSDADEMTESLNKTAWKLFWSHFSVVFIAELGDKTQIATLAVAIENQSHLLVVFAGSATALITVTGITVWGVAKIPGHLVKVVQKAGAALMIAYGVYMFV